MSLEAQRRLILTPEVIEELLDRYRVPDEKRGIMRTIIDVYIRHADDPKRFAREARAYTVREHIEVADANAALMIFTQIRGDIGRLLERSIREN